MDFRGLVWKRVWRISFLVWNQARIWRIGRHTPTKNSQEYPPPGRDHGLRGNAPVDLVLGRALSQIKGRKSKYTAENHFIAGFSRARSTAPYKPLHLSRGKILQFKRARVSIGSKSHGHPDLSREKKYNNNQADSFFRLNFNVYINVGNRERARARDEKTKETNYSCGA